MSHGGELPNPIFRGDEGEAESSLELEGAQGLGGNGFRDPPPCLTLSSLTFRGPTWLCRGSAQDVPRNRLDPVNSSTEVTLSTGACPVARAPLLQTQAG